MMPIASSFGHENAYNAACNSLPLLPLGALKDLGKKVRTKQGWQPYFDPAMRLEQLGRRDYTGKGKIAQFWVPAKDKKRPQGGQGGQGGGYKGTKKGDGAESSAAAPHRAREERERRFMAGLRLLCGQKGHMKPQVLAQNPCPAQLHAPQRSIS